MYISLSVRRGEKGRKEGENNQRGGEHRAQRRNMVVMDVKSGPSVAAGGDCNVVKSASSDFTVAVRNHQSWPDRPTLFPNSRIHNKKILACRGNRSGAAPGIIGGNLGTNEVRRACMVRSQHFASWRWLVAPGRHSKPPDVAVSVDPQSTYTNQGHTLGHP